MGIALRMAAAMSPEDLCRYIEKQVMGELQQPE